MTAFGQSGKWRVHYGVSPVDRTPVCEGYIVTNNNDTLQGLVKFYEDHRGYPFLQNGKKEVVTIPLRNIHLMHLYATPFLGHATDFVVLKKTMWRLLKIKDSVSICDDAIAPDYFGYGKKMILITQGKRVKLYHSMAWFLHNSKVEPLLLKYINRHGQTVFTKKDFPTADDMIEYILHHSPGFIALL